MRLKDIVETFRKDFQDPEFVRGYLQDPLDEDIPSFLIALGDAVKANHRSLDRPGTRHHVRKSEEKLEKVGSSLALVVDKGKPDTME